MVVNVVVVSIYIARSSVVPIEVAEMNIALSDVHDQVDFKLTRKLFSADLVEKCSAVFFSFCWPGENCQGTLFYEHLAIYSVGCMYSPTCGSTYTIVKSYVKSRRPSRTDLTSSHLNKWFSTFFVQAREEDSTRCHQQHWSKYARNCSNVRAQWVH